jgi:transposase
MGVLKGWIQKHHDHQSDILAGRNGTQSPEAELKQLRKENEQLRGSAFLKKAVAIFSTDPHRYSGS